ncbi:MAG: hypothetical protein A3E01_18290 [Gammaproteobacteria bacterium RIFCSPHIGHO2_12_FULL_63_22]|nr:MAG: hypothetical protein A3E01_18290 [Gammaproteobacteria bacterium RIFCSPHIGHO2_12_FULL_63_22]
MPNTYRQQQPKGRLVRPFVFAFFTAGLLGCTAMAAQDSPPPEASVQADASAPSGRLRPSPQLACDRNNLTSYSGVVSGYRVDPDNTHFEISTDEDTVEALAVDHDGQADGRAHYLLWGAPFTAADFAQIEKSPGVLIDGMRAVAWVCDDGKTPPVIDWQPKRD